MVKPHKKLKAWHDLNNVMVEGDKLLSGLLKLIQKEFADE